MLTPGGKTVAHELNVACKIARSVAPKWFHCDEVESAAGEALAIALNDFRGGNKYQWYARLRLAIRFVLREDMRKWRQRGVRHSGGRTKLVPHGWEEAEDYSSPALNYTAGLEADEVMGSIPEFYAEIVRRRGMGHTCHEIAELTGYMPGSIAAYSSRARRLMEQQWTSP